MSRTELPTSELMSRNVRRFEIGFVSLSDGASFSLHFRLMTKECYYDLSMSLTFTSNPTFNLDFVHPINPIPITTDRYSRCTTKHSRCGFTFSAPSFFSVRSTDRFNSSPPMAILLKSLSTCSTIVVALVRCSCFPLRLICSIHGPWPIIYDRFTWIILESISMGSRRELFCRSSPIERNGSSEANHTR